MRLSRVIASVPLVRSDHVRDHNTGKSDPTGENQKLREQIQEHHSLLLGEALDHAAQGIPVFPCNLYKRPMTACGFKDATTDVGVIRGWFRDNLPIPAIATPTGPKSGKLAIDVDMDGGKSGGKSLTELEEKYGPIPKGNTVRTGGGGLQYILRFPPGSDPRGTIRNSAGNKLGAGIDIRGEGGYVIVPPSVSHKGDYVWESRGESLEDAPEWLIDLLLAPTKTKSGESPTSGTSDFVRDEEGKSTIPDGSRDATLFGRARSLAMQGYPEEAIVAAIEKTDDVLSECPGGKDTTDRAAAEIARHAFSKYQRGQFWASRAEENKEPLPFPLQAMPVKTRALIRETARTMDIPPDLVGAPVLAALSAAVGNSVRGNVNGLEYRVSAALYVASIADPGASKTPAQRVAFTPILGEQARLAEGHAEERREYERERRRYDALQKRERANQDPPDKPVYPRTWVDNTTVEALVPILRDNPRGICLIQDELSGWIASFNQYKGKGNDKQFFLSLWSNAPVQVDRKTYDIPDFVSSPFATLFGGIQPGRLGDLVDGREDGFVDRFLLSYPDSHVSRPTFEGISPKARDTYHSLIRDLYTFGDADGEPEEIAFSGDAFTRYKECVDLLWDEIEYGGHGAGVKSALKKYGDYLGRLSLILAMCRVAETVGVGSDGWGQFLSPTASTANDANDANGSFSINSQKREVLSEDVERAHQLIQYFVTHLYKVHSRANDKNANTRVAFELINYLNNNSNGDGVAKSALEWANVLPSAPDNAKATANLLRRIAQEEENVVLDPGWGHSGRVLRIKLKTTVGIVGNVGTESPNGHHNTTETPRGEGV
jgi:hypothetical protein